MENGLSTSEVFDLMVNGVSIDCPLGTRFSEF